MWDLSGDVQLRMGELLEFLVTKMLLFSRIITLFRAAVGFVNLHRASWQRSKKYLRLQRDEDGCEMPDLPLHGTAAHFPGRVKLRLAKRHLTVCCTNCCTIVSRNPRNALKPLRSTYTSQQHTQGWVL